MYNYPKSFLTCSQIVQKLVSQGMIIDSVVDAEMAIRTKGYYRLRGYCFHLYDQSSKRFYAGTNLSEICMLCDFDHDFSMVLFDFIAKIEIALRARFIEAMSTIGDPLILSDPSQFSDKKKYWQNCSLIASEIVRSKDSFIKHNYDNYEGAVPLWATVEVLSFGTLSKIIKTLNNGSGTAFCRLAGYYRYISQNNNTITPTQRSFCSWTQSVSVLRNMCAHNSRIYNRTIDTRPVLVGSDIIQPPPRYSGVYQVILAMKYLRPSDLEWNDFVCKMSVVLQKYKSIVDLSRIGFPSDWEDHFVV